MSSYTFPSFSSTSYLVKDENSFAVVFRNWLPKEETKELFKYLENIKGKQQYPIRLPYSDKFVLQKRLNWACGDESISTHKYSGSAIPIIPWTSEIAIIRDRIHEEFKWYPNSCLLNEYRNGEDVIGYHGDKECSPPLNMVVTISVGASRKFYFKRNSDRKVTKTVLNDGDLVLMFGEIQRKYKHCIPQEKRVKDKRYSLTFRELR
jgi:Alkylated DNA repair protein